MFSYTDKELAVIDQQLEPLLVRAAEQGVEAQQLALDATRLLSCTEDRLNKYKNKGFFKRCWSRLSGKTGALERANVNDLIEMQKIGWRYLTMLQERDLLLAHSIVTVKNNLLTLAVHEAETRRSILDLAERIASRFSVLEDRVGKLEVATNIHSWLLTLDTFDYDEKFPPYTRLLRVVRDFYQLKSGDWNLQEIKYLQKAVKEVGLQPKSKVTIEEFLNCLLDEIDQHSVDTFRNLVCLPSGEKDGLIPSRFVLDEIAVPFYASLARIEEDYSDCLRTIEVLADRLSITVREAHRETLMTFVRNDGIDTSVAIPLRDLAVELLVCMGMTAQLYSSPRLGMETEEASQENRASKLPCGDSTVIDEVFRLYESVKEKSVAEIEAVITSDVVDAAENAANTGNTVAQFLFGSFLNEGIHRESKPEMAVKWFRLAAEQGNANAQVALGFCYWYGEGVPGNKEEAVKWFRLAAEQGNAVAQAGLGDCYLDGTGVPEDKQEALKWYRLAAEQGDDEAQYTLGKMYSEGTGAPKDEEEALKWYRLAAEQGDLAAQIILGQMYSEGTGAPKDEEEAAKWFSMATERHDYLIGNTIVSINGGSFASPQDRDWKIVQKWYRLAAEHGNPNAQYRLGMSYKYGDMGLRKIRKLSQEWLLKAAEQGHEDAMAELGM